MSSDNPLMDYFREVISKFNDDVLIAIPEATDLELFICSDNLGTLTQDETKAVRYFLHALELMREYLVEHMTKEWKELYYLVCEFVNHARGCTMFEIMYSHSVKMSISMSTVKWDDLEAVLRVAIFVGDIVAVPYSLPDRPKGDLDMFLLPKNSIIH